MQHPFDDRVGPQPDQLPARSFVLPASAVPGPNPSFPVIGAIAPVVGAVAIWLMTGSPFVLLFAGLGPIVAVASVLDQRRQRRRQRQRNQAEFETALVVLGRSVAEEIDRRRDRLHALTPGAGELLRSSRSGDDRWRALDAGQRVSLGSGTVPSNLRLDDRAGGEADPCVTRLRECAATIPDAPVMGDCQAGIAICGPPAIARAIARGYLVQVLSALSPERLHLVLPATNAWVWGRTVPHTAAHLEVPVAPTRARMTLEVLDLCGEIVGVREQRAASVPSADLGREVGSMPSRIVVAPSARQLPDGCTILVRVLGVDRASITVGTRAQAHVRSELVSLAEVAEFAGVLHEHARERGAVISGGDRWQPVRLAQLLEAEPPKRQGTGETSLARPTLAAPVGRLGEETITLDLVLDGPHALVGGTTGSGKSELLVTWVTAMAAMYSMEEVTFLLVDFKGGAAFAPLAGLPHCVGVITDLGRIEANRALESLGAEITHREKVLRVAGVRDIAELPGTTLPRLVVVVDEFAAMLDDHPGLHALFVDIAARGRSLGMHIILCTQRPAGVVRDALLANCNLRLSLRVNNRSDSEAVIGTAAATMLPASSPGACCLAADGRAVRFMVATTELATIEQVGACSEPAPVPSRRPWLEALPAVIGFASLRAMADATGPGDDVPGDDVPGEDTPGRERAGDLLLGITDLPERQRQDVLRYRPAADGNLLLLGAGRTGKSSGLRLLAAQSQTACRVHQIPRGIEGAWDAITGMARGVLSGDRPDAAGTVLLIDDLDSLVTRIPAEYTHEFLDALHLLARDGSRVGIQLVVTVRRSTGLAGILPLFEQVIMLRMGSKEEHVLAGGEAARFDAALPPGGGIHRQHRVQLAVPDAVGTLEASEPEPEPEPAALDFVPGRGYLVVSARPMQRARQLRAIPGARLRVVDIGRQAEQAREFADQNEPGAASPDETPGPDEAPGSRMLQLGQTEATVLIGDADRWQSQPALISRLRHNCMLVFDGCSLADYRMITRSRDLPPPLEPGASRVWWCTGDTEVVRARWPHD